MNRLLNITKKLFTVLLLIFAIEPRECFSSSYSQFINEAPEASATKNENVVDYKKIIDMPVSKKNKNSQLKKWLPVGVVGGLGLLGSLFFFRKGVSKPEEVERNSTRFVDRFEAFMKKSSDKYFDNVDGFYSLKTDYTKYSFVPAAEFMGNLITILSNSDDIELFRYNENEKPFLVIAVKYRPFEKGLFSGVSQYKKVLILGRKFFKKHLHDKLQCVFIAQDSRAEIANQLNTIVQLLNQIVACYPEELKDYKFNITALNGHSVQPNGLLEIPSKKELPKFDERNSKELIQTMLPCIISDINQEIKTLKLFDGKIESKDLMTQAYFNYCLQHMTLCADPSNPTFGYTSSYTYNSLATFQKAIELDRDVPENLTMYDDLKSEAFDKAVKNGKKIYECITDWKLLYPLKAREFLDLLVYIEVLRNNIKV